jgi:hypothetical protein
MAIDYPWCAQGGGIGGSPQCSYGTFQQCQAAISGLGGTCVQNPAASYSQNTAPQPSPEGPYGRGARAMCITARESMAGIMSKHNTTPD